MHSKSVKARAKVRVRVNKKSVQDRDLKTKRLKIENTRIHHDPHLVSTERNSTKVKEKIRENNKDVNKNIENDCF